MENQKNNKGVIALLIVIIVILSALCILFATGMINFKSNNIDNNDINENTNNISNNEDNNGSNQNINDNNNAEHNDEENIKKQNVTINKDELTKFGKSDYNFIKVVYNSEYSFKLDVDGRININFENYLSNISNAKDLLLFSPPSPHSILYILTTDGNVYKYETSSYGTKNYNATKIEQYSNIVQIINYETRKENAGGCDYVILVDEAGKYYELDSFCI